MKAVIKYTLIITLLFLTVLIALMILSSRYHPKYKNSVYYNERSDLLVLFTYSIPFVGDLDVERLGDVEIYPVETDEYGRTLGILQFKPKMRFIASCKAEAKRNAAFMRTSAVSWWKTAQIPARRFSS